METRMGRKTTAPTGEGYERQYKEERPEGRLSQHINLTRI